MAVTFIAKYEVSSWTTASTPKTASVTTAVGDFLVCLAVTRDAGTTLSSITGGTGLSWTLQTYDEISSTCAVYILTATATTAETFTATGNAVSGGTLGQWGFSVLRFSGVSSIGAKTVAQSTGAPTLAVSTTSANSTLVVVNGDWNAVDGTSRAYLTNFGTFTEQTYMRQSLGYTVYTGFYANTGALATSNAGLSAPSGQKYTIAAVELIGSTATYSPPPQNKMKRLQPYLVR